MSGIVMDGGRGGKGGDDGWGGVGIMGGEGVLGARWVGVSLIGIIKDEAFCEDSGGWIELYYSYLLRSCGGKVGVG